jgi:adenylosuccinate synthase
LPQVTVLVGAQWGDEGKGKWIDILADGVDVVVRYQGGNNAGHTLYVNGQKVVLHQLPSGVFHPSQICALASGVVVNPGELMGELDRLEGRVELGPDRLWMSARAHVITPWHIHLDAKAESRRAAPIGTTKRGIGPTYSEKAARTGLRLGHYVDARASAAWLERMGNEEPEFKAHYTAQKEAWEKFFAAAERLKPFVCDAEAKVRAAARAGKRLLLEGAQGAMLDIDHGTYPFVTSSSTGVGGAVQSLGLAPRLIGRVIGVAKAYATRVGEGPFPTELTDQVGKSIAERGKEFGATTGRPRRVGWLDAVALRYAVEVNGMDAVVLNKMDILTGVETLKIAVAYQHPEHGRITELPWDTTVLAKCTPVYESFPGWTTEIPKSGTYAELPKTAQEYVKAVERYVGCRVTMVGTGPERKDALYPA